MKTLSDNDAQMVLRTLRWAAVQGDGTIAACERRRIASLLIKKLTRKWTSSKKKE